MTSLRVRSTGHGCLLLFYPEDFVHGPRVSINVPQKWFNLRPAGQHFDDWVPAWWNWDRGKDNDSRTPGLQYSRIESQILVHSGVWWAEVWWNRVEVMTLSPPSQCSVQLSYKIITLKITSFLEHFPFSPNDHFSFQHHHPKLPFKKLFNNNLI